MKFFLKCDEAANVCDKSQYEEASFFDKLLLKLHLLMCKLCSSYVEQNVKLTNSVKSAKIKTLNIEEKQALKNRLQEELNKDY